MSNTRSFGPLSLTSSHSYKSDALTVLYSQEYVYSKPFIAYSTILLRYTGGLQQISVYVIGRVYLIFIYTICILYILHMYYLYTIYIYCIYYLYTINNIHAILFIYTTYMYYISYIYVLYKIYKFI